MNHNFNEAELEVSSFKKFTGGGVVVVVGWRKILVSAPVPLELILTGFDWVGAGPWRMGFWDGA